MSLKKWGSKKKNLLSRRLKKRYKMLYFVLVYASCPSNPWNFNLVLTFFLKDLYESTTQIFRYQTIDIHDIVPSDFIQLR